MQFIIQLLYKFFTYKSLIENNLIICNSFKTILKLFIRKARFQAKISKSNTSNKFNRLIKQTFLIKPGPTLN